MYCLVLGHNQIDNPIARYRQALMSGATLTSPVGKMLTFIGTSYNPTSKSLNYPFKHR